MAGSAALLLPGFLSSCGKDEPLQPIVTDKAVLIIGAGIAGLAAARRLRERGVQAIVLESQEKWGGRLRTDRSLGVAFDEGASWIHGPRGNPITGLADEAGATTFFTDDDDIKVFNLDGTRYADSALDDAESAYEDALEAVIEAGAANRSFEDVFSQLFPDRINDRLWKYMLSTYLEFDTGGDISELSSRQFDDDEAFRGDDDIITNGFDKVADFLAQGLDIRLNEKVVGIDHAGARIVVQTTTDTYTADYVLIAVPLGVLQRNVIAFAPALPGSKLEAIAGLRMGAINKFLFVWPEAFWEDLQYIGITPDVRGKFSYFLNVRKFAPVNALMTFAFGNYGRATEAMSDTAITDAVMGHLRAIYGQNIPMPSAMLRTRWSENPHTFGAYSFAAAGIDTSAFDALAAPVENRLLFAGEHTSRDYRGTVHGAYLTGIREGDRLIALLEE